MTIAELNERHGRPGVLRFETGQGGLTRAVVTHPAASGEVYLHGAHVTAWQPRGERPVLWMSERSQFEPGKPIRGGVPICFPWFGPKADDPAAPPHGVARLAEWEVESVAEESSGITLAFGGEFDRYRVGYTVRFGEALSLNLRVTNLGSEPRAYEVALHTYIAVGDIRDTRVRGLEATPYLDSLAGRQEVAATGEPITFSGETDRIYLDGGPEVRIDDTRGDREIRVRKQGSQSTVVWNPWVAKAARMPDFGDHEWPGMLCIETANVAGQAVTLPPAGVHETAATLSVHPRS